MNSHIQRWKRPAGGFGAALVGLFLANGAIAEEWTAPKTSFGHPDLQGVWTNATMTPFERPGNFGTQRALPEKMAQRLESNNPFERMKEADSRRTDPDAPAPEAGQGVGGYNAFWMDPGTKIAKIDGEYRTSIIIEPEDGQVPYSEAGQKMFEQGYGQRRSDIGLDGPEVRGLGERCLVGFGSTGGPPMLPVLYNNHYRIVQSPEHVMIMVEMNHDARVIRLQDDHMPSGVRKWLGDSVGHWEGNTLVVETVNFHPAQSIRAATRHRLYIPPTATVVERFTRVGPDKIKYRFTVKDEVAYTQPWTGELPLLKSDEQIFEYACHEGNYSLPGILAGGREDEKKAQSEK